MVAMALTFCAKSQISEPVVLNSDSLPVIDNGILTLKLDLPRGGAICYLFYSDVFTKRILMCPNVPMWFIFN